MDFGDCFRSKKQYIGKDSDISRMFKKIKFGKMFSILVRYIVLTGLSFVILYPLFVKLCI